MKLAKKEKSFGDWSTWQLEAQGLERQLAAHKRLEDEAKGLKVLIKSTEKNRDELVERARAAISSSEARQIILRRLEVVLMESYRQYLREDQRAIVQELVNLWDKYAVTATHIESARQEAASTLESFLLELGYG